jgi:site-specific DNA-methyltransferase (cytosine-N4-specific)
MLLSFKNIKPLQWNDVGSNAAQNYLTHSVFRYFGKLPPVLTANILKEFLPLNKKKSPIVLDLMCGSGTTLVEAQRIGVRSIGVDSNNLSLLISKVKTTPLNIVMAETALKEFAKKFVSSNKKADTSKMAIKQQKFTLEKYIPPVKNINKWFSEESQYNLAACRVWLEKYKNSEDLYNLLFVSWLSIIRQCSNASVRTGRIFYDSDKSQQPVFSHFHKKLEKNIELFSKIPTKQFDLRPQLFVGDSRCVKLPLNEKADFTFFHPPYFALYKYSSDVLRFELEWGGFNRKEILNREITDGFKTSNPNLADIYVDDLVKVIENGFLHTKKGRGIGIVVGNSTLSEKQLPIVKNILNRCKSRGMRCETIIERPIKHSQATYHKSANHKIKSTSDYLLLFTKE